MDLNDTSDITYTQIEIDISGSNETMQNAFKNLENLNFCVFHSIWVKFDGRDTSKGGSRRREKIIGKKSKTIFDF